MPKLSLSILVIKVIESFAKGEVKKNQLLSSCRIEEAPIAVALVYDVKEGKG